MWRGSRIRLRVWHQDCKCLCVPVCPLSLCSLWDLANEHGAKMLLPSQEYPLSALEEGSKMQKVLRVKMLLGNTSLPTLRVCSVEESKPLVLCAAALCVDSWRNGLTRGWVGRNVRSWWHRVQTLRLTCCRGGWAERRRWRCCVQRGTSLVSAVLIVVV